HRPPQGTPPHGPKSPCPCQRRRHQRRARRRRLQLSPPPRMAEAFVAQNPDCVQPNHPAQIRLKSGSSRATNYYLPGTDEVIPADVAAPSPDDRFHHCIYHQETSPTTSSPRPAIAVAQSSASLPSTCDQARGLR